jgi:hypothetical protein
MTSAKILAACVVLSAAFSMTAEAKLYKWVDDAGVTHYGEVVPPEYADKPRTQIDKGREVSEPKKKAAGADAGKKTAEEQAVIDQRRKDNALLNTYSNEKEIDLARDRNLQQVNARINSVQLMQKSAQEELDGYVKEGQELTKAGKKIPLSLQNDLADAKNKVARLQQELEQAQEKAASVKASFAADKARYRELTGIAPAKK